MDAPVGQLPYGTPAAVSANRIRQGDEAGEDCRQTVARFRMKLEVYQEVLMEMGKLFPGSKVIIDSSDDSQ